MQTLKASGISTPSDTERLLTPSNAGRIFTSSNAWKLFSMLLADEGELEDEDWEEQGGGDFQSYLENARPDGIRHLETGDPGIFSHCNGAEGCGDSWIVKDHRTEGEIHINKRDLNLYKGESEEYSSFGDTEGDGSLEGAVYGLFAAEDIVHPDSELGGDGKLTNTGIVYKKDDLTAVAATTRMETLDLPFIQRRLEPPLIMMQEKRSDGRIQAGKVLETVMGKICPSMGTAGSGGL